MTRLPPRLAFPSKSRACGVVLFMFAQVASGERPFCALVWQRTKITYTTSSSKSIEESGLSERSTNPYVFGAV